MNTKNYGPNIILDRRKGILSSGHAKWSIIIMTCSLLAANIIKYGFQDEDTMSVGAVSTIPHENGATVKKFSSETLLFIEPQTTAGHVYDAPHPTLSIHGAGTEGSKDFSQTLDTLFIDAGSYEDLQKAIEEFMKKGGKFEDIANELRKATSDGFLDFLRIHFPRQGGYEYLNFLARDISQKIDTIGRDLAKNDESLSYITHSRLFEIQTEIHILRDILILRKEKYRSMDELRSINLLEGEIETIQAKSNIVQEQLGRLQVALYLSDE